EPVWRAKRAALEARCAAFSRLRAARPSDPLVADYHAFARQGGETLRRFAAFQATADGKLGENWRAWPQGLRDGEPKAIDAAIERNRQAFEFALFCQWLADRQLGRAAARARKGWASFSAVYRANMRHAGMLRIDHAMGLERLFLIPEGARPAEGAYLAYPFDDLIGHVALESERAQCMVVGEDLGTVPE